MPSSTTIFRAVVMVAVGAGVFKGWQMFGPPTEQVKSIAVRAVDIAQAAWKNFQTPEKDAQPAANAAAAIQPLAQVPQQSGRDMAIAPPQLSSAQTLTPSPPMDAAPNGSIPSAQAPITPLGTTSPAANSNDDRVHTLMSRLEQLGGSDSKLAPWGSSGRLFRCSCQAPITNSAAVTQHFESVAAEPALAVEQVVAKVEAWRTAQRNGGILRY